MRSAEEIYESNVEYERTEVSERLKRSILGAIMQAQREAIKEAAEVASIQFHNYDNSGNIINVRGMGFVVSLDETPTSDYVSVDKQSILQLLNQIQ